MAGFSSGSFSGEVGGFSTAASAALVKIIKWVTHLSGIGSGGTNSIHRVD